MSGLQHNFKLVSDGFILDVDTLLYMNTEFVDVQILDQSRCRGKNLSSLFR